MSDSSETVLFDHESTCLRDNPLGDPHTRRVEVHLPPGYDGVRPFPVIYWLPGFGAHPSLCGKALAFGTTVADRLRSAMTDGRVPPALIVVPDGTTAYGGSQYIDSAPCGRYAGYLAEIVAAVDRRFTTRPAPRWRAIGGKSSGGYGALIAGMTCDLFGSVIACSPDAGFEHSHLPLLPRTLDTVRAAGGMDALLARRATGPVDAPFMVAMSIIALGMCYAQDPRTSPSDALPCDPETGVFRDEVWQRWLTHDPVRMLDEHAGALTRLDHLHLGVGERDEYGMHWGARALHTALDAHGVPHHYTEHEGGHHGIEHVYTDALAGLRHVWSERTVGTCAV
ncbi:alpha/beta hydrolase [Streptomyces brevispora]|uniref:Esterase family protein n=1 Tax=Streptomyces brevispora TaxID=887462 RepID=A0A561TYD3_9ACTN|nr:alpha/beta hydrolase-fold protein [Streptomyces brevispora]TWF92120.1 putative esterase [Streptomyces brevispora]WSC11575.1 esterase family protein [Streptomyces brevispora]WSC17536.1 esterase family protein [Streptomyces brevispora]